MKKIYIRENQINKDLLLPQFLFKAVRAHETSLGDNPAFPSEDNYAFDYTILKERYRDVYEKVHELGMSTNINTDELTTMLSKMVTACRGMEKPVRDSLEKICENTVNRIFAIPDGAVNIKCKLVDNISYKISVSVTPEVSSGDTFKFKDVNDFELSKVAIAKRRFINALIMGAAGIMVSLKEYYQDEINKINPELLPLYDKIMALNEYILFVTKEQMTDEKPKQGSYVEVYVGGNGKKSTIEAQGIIFPLLLHDTLKGLFELFSVHGLPEDKDKREYIIKKSDFLLAEPWDMRLGVPLWNRIFGTIGEMNIIPYVFMYLIKLPAEEFNQTMKELLMNTEKGDEVMSELIAAAQHNDGYQKFKKRINARNVERSVIADSYFTAAELDGFNIDGDENDGDVIEELTEGLIIESQESKSIAQAKKLVMSRLNYTEEQADEFVRIKLRNEFPSLREPNAAKFILGVTRILLDRQLTDGATSNEFNEILKYVASDTHINEYDRNLNGLSAQELIRRFETVMTDNLNRIKMEIDSMIFDRPSEYEIVRIDDFYQSEEYGEHVSWCVTHDESMFNSYTKEGINQFYFCLRNGFDYEPEETGEGCPLDDYGLSMIAVSVTPSGALNTCTCRWNHDNDGNDHIMDYKQISEVIQKNFFEVFKPNGLFDELVQKALSRILKGADPLSAFDDGRDYNDGYAAVSIRSRWNYVSKDGKLLLDDWLLRAGDFIDGYAIILDESKKYNVIDLNGSRIFKNEYSNIERDRDFEGFFKVVIKDEQGGHSKENIIDINENPIYDTWFDKIGRFFGGYCNVKLNGKENIISKNGKLVSDTWFDEVGSPDFKRSILGHVLVKKDGKYNLMDMNGNLITNMWFDNSQLSFNGNFCRVMLDGKTNFLKLDGTLLSDMWFNYANVLINTITQPNENEFYYSHGMFALVTAKENKQNILMLDGKFLSSLWFDSIGLFNEMHAIVKLNDKFNFINIDGNLVSKIWFDSVEQFKKNRAGKYAIVMLNGKKNILWENGKLLSNIWFDSIFSDYEKYFIVENDDKYNIIFVDGSLLSDTWFDGLGSFYYGAAKVDVGDYYNYIRPDGTYVSDIWFNGPGGCFSKHWRNGEIIANASIEGDDSFNCIDLNGKHYLMQQGYIIPVDDKKGNQW